MSPPSDKKCYVCGKPGCWSTKHSGEERRQAYSKFKAKRGQDNTQDAFLQFLSQHEGHEPLDDNSEDTRQYLQRLEVDDHDDNSGETFHTSTAYFGSTAINGHAMATALMDQAAFHAITKQYPSLTHSRDNADEVFTLEDRYSHDIFHGIMPDTGAAGFSTAGHPQVLALQRAYPASTLDTTTAGQAHIRFGSGKPLDSIGTVAVPSPFGTMEFHVVMSNTPFLLCLRDMDRMGIRFDNLTNQLQQGPTIIPVVRKWGHPWMLLNQPERSIAWNHLTDVELRRLHRRFGHPSVGRLHKVLQQSGNDVEVAALEHLSKFCHHCQMHGAAPSRFKFKLNDEYNFNYEVIIDIMYLDGNKPVLHVVDTATAFNAARFMKDITAKHTWDVLRLCWIDVYQGPPDYVVTDAGRNFTSTEFHQSAKDMAINIKEVPVEAHHSVGKVERYHAVLRRAYEIIREESPLTTPDSALQSAVKSINDTAGPNGIIPTLLVFGAYPRTTMNSPPSPEVTRRADAFQKAMDAVRKLHAKRQVAEALATRNGPHSIAPALPLQSLVRVWREGKGWRGPFTLLAVDGENCTIDANGPRTFRSTSVKPYHEMPIDKPSGLPSSSVVDNNHPDPDPAPVNEPALRRSGRLRKPPLANYSDASQFSQEIDNASAATVFITRKEQDDGLLAVTLREKGVISTPGKPFEQSTTQEINSLIDRGVFVFTKYDHAKHGNIRIFKSRIVNEVKGKTTQPYEKSRLVIQGYADKGKDVILTQSPTIQRASQRLILALAPSLLRDGYCLWIRDITQAYVQSDTRLNRMIIAHLPKQIRHLYPERTIMEVVKPLYGIAEAGTHWWATYNSHHRKKLQMIPSTYDPCLLLSTLSNLNFGIVGMQTDDTLGLTDVPFSDMEEEELTKAAFTAKPLQHLAPNEPLIFNGGVVTMEANGTLVLRQKGQGAKLSLIDTASLDARHQYIEQRARGAYIASICQPEACFDLSTAAQHQEPTPDQIKALNKRLQWQIHSLQRGLTFYPLDLPTAKLFVFVDGSFANNSDFTSQLGFLITLANDVANPDQDEFALHGNVIHFSSTKSKRVTRSVLASEVYGMVAGVDMAYAISSTLSLITEHLKMPTIPTIVCTDSYSLYECLVKLGTTKEKRLMIDIMALRQSYERRELMEIRWIRGDDNLADGFTKATPNKALEDFITKGNATVRMEGWVTRK